jgi:hypothetical protein
MQGQGDLRGFYTQTPLNVSLSTFLSPLCTRRCPIWEEECVVILHSPLSFSQFVRILWRNKAALWSARYRPQRSWLVRWPSTRDFYHRWYECPSLVSPSRIIPFSEGLTHIELSSGFDSTRVLMSKVWTNGRIWRWNTAFMSRWVISSHLSQSWLSRASGRLGVQAAIKSVALEWSTSNCGDQFS